MSAVRRFLLLALVVTVAGWTIDVAAERPGAPPSDVTATATGNVLAISNQHVSARFSTAGGKLTFVSSGETKGARRTPPLDGLFAIALDIGTGDESRLVLSSNDLRVSGRPRVDDLAANAAAPQLASHSAGKAIAVALTSPAVPGPVVWRVVMRDGADYWQQELSIGPVTKDVAIVNVALINTPAAGARVDGTAQGSPVVAGDAFLGVEHPMSQCRVTGDDVQCSLARTVPLRAGQTLTLSAVVGLADPGQLRRGFNAYIERERVHPYRPFLHYNSWYDLGYFTPYNEQDALNVIDAFGHELVEQRGVTMSSFLFDDGWDSHTSLWSFNSGFPNGFLPLKTEAAKFHAAPGVWMSPFGGYGAPRTERLTYGKAQGFETNERGFALSGPVYYKRFRDVCVEMMTKFGVNQFKFDGIGRATGVVPGSQFGSDFEAAIHLIRDELRAIKPDVFVNLTTGTWPSPFWLQYADSIWRGGEDHSFVGVGTKRQQWVTYRDAQTYKNVVTAGPLFPLTSLMLHGIIYARDADNLKTDPGDDFRDEVRAYFGTGTQLQEMYITPSLLTAKNWDDLAEAAKWAATNADVLVDTHWIGGDPAKLEVYGHAAWTPRLGIIVLRNPSDRPASFPLDVAQAFELPAGATRVFTARSPWQSDRAAARIGLAGGTPTTISLKPFEVLTLNATPERR